jgi:uncharacterized protein (DUF302 family)
LADFYEQRIAGRVDDVRARLEAELKQRGFGTMHVHEVDTILNSKGVEFPTPMRIMDICNPRLAKQALDGTGNRIAPLLPCSVALWQDGDSVVVRFLRPTELARFFPDSEGLDELARGVNEQIEAAIAAVSG